jgi:hypothetical protein
MVETQIFEVPSRGILRPSGQSASGQSQPVGLRQATKNRFGPIVLKEAYANPADSLVRICENFIIVGAALSLRIALKWRSDCLRSTFSTR